MIYYLIQAYHKEVDKQYHRHLYPTYLTSYKMQLGGDSFGLQSGLHDALKFTSEETAKIWLEKGKNTFKGRDWELVPVDSRIFGRAKLEYVIE